MTNILPAAYNRRALMQGTFIGAAGLMAAGLLLPTKASASLPSTIPGTGDFQVLNYALQLEDLEANLYAQALLRLTTGGTTAQTSASVGTITGLQLSSSQIDVQYITEFAPIEAAHRDFLKAALGSIAITTLKPSKYNFGLQTMTRSQVLDLVLEAEATGVQAYLGAIPYFKAKSPYLQTAAAIQGTEARHATTLTLVRNILSGMGIVSDPIAPVAPLRGDGGISPGASGYLSATPNSGTVYGADVTMSPDQVLARVGGFIRTT